MARHRRTGGNGSGSHRADGRRRGSDSSSEGFRDAIGADKWYIGGRTAAGEERFFKLGVVRRVRSNDGLSLDRLSL
ncbi:NAD dependent epimerase/dehydratase family [Geosmithia morbida]|uniref:NAD dependent epimerase/dehydratase family n=1 Tax=Geosmithia morbida TaxID=1094350 RepID=A0A9P5D583_9HYPO|nr:NAD dependent epimerase/dehydratase family [Geosmithia morbida]KAF4126917.1 NAD dependent epimerase/dehydratase family [Geosmithia morbida]